MGCEIVKDIMGNRFFEKLNGMNRRQLLSRAGIAAGWTSVIHREPAAAAPGALEIGSSIYQSIGVRPLINCRGTFTIITGSQTLPEVKRAMDEASRHYVDLDELADGV